MKSVDEIKKMIETAQAGDGDKVLDICEALLEQLRDAHRMIEILADNRQPQMHDPRQKNPYSSQD